MGLSVTLATLSENNDWLQYDHMGTFYALLCWSVNEIHCFLSNMLLSCGSDVSPTHPIGFFSYHRATTYKVWNQSRLCILKYHVNKVFQVWPLWPRWPLNSIKNNRIHPLTIWHPNTKYKEHLSFISWDIVLTRFSLASDDLRLSQKKNSLLPLHMGHPHVKYEECVSFPSCNIVL